MSGQSANLSISEAKAMQNRVQVKGTHSMSNGGGGSKSPKSGGKMSHESMKKGCPNCGNSPCTC